MLEQRVSECPCRSDRTGKFRQSCDINHTYTLPSLFIFSIAFGIRPTGAPEETLTNLPLLLRPRKHSHSICIVLAPQPPLPQDCYAPRHTSH